MSAADTAGIMEPQVPLFELLKWEQADDLPEPWLRHKHNCDTILFFDSGYGTHEMDYTKYPISPRSLHFISRRRMHRIEHARNLSGYSLMISEPVYTHLPERTLNKLPFNIFTDTSPVINLAPAEFDTITSLIAEISGLNPERANSKNEIGAYLNILFSYIDIYQDRRGEENKTLAKSTVIKTYLQLVRQHCMQHLSVHAYADILCISPNYLNDRCKRELGVTAQQVIKTVLVNEARPMLLFSGKTVKEIAFDLGFQTCAHFTHFFKKYTGQSPSFYRDYYDQ